MWPRSLWQLAEPFHSLAGTRFEVQAFKAGVTKAENRCLFCSVQFTELDSQAQPILVYASAEGHLLCQACFCEYKDDFSWPTAE